MNITELARNLKITPNELRNIMPRFGFDIGAKAIKINKSVANRIIKNWPKIKRQLEQEKAKAEKEAEMEEQQSKEKGELLIPAFITIREFAALSDTPVNIILSELMKNGIFASLNEKIDYDTAWLIGEALGYEVKKKEGEDEVKNDVDKLDEILKAEDEQKLLSRPPVIVVMGHVDHGKTKLLDAVRRTDVTEGEMGGITQHIGAYQVERRKQLITFVDTPGHEAFTAMRSRGARIADVAILVVAADDGVKPQTTEAYKIIQAAKIPFVVAINKIDKPEANIEKTKQELVNKLNIVPEDWGGKIICSPISAKNEQGIVELLDMILLTAETEATNIKANPEASAAGTVIESHIDKGAGPVATILIQNGTLAVGDSLILDGKNIGKIKALNDCHGDKIMKADPATPVQILGLKTMPHVGDVIEVGEGERVKHKKMKNVFASPEVQSSEESEDVEKINLIIKSDVLGSVEAIEESMEKINTRDVRVKIVKKGLGNITDSDVKRAEATGAKVVGFNVKTSPQVEDLAREMKVEIKLYNIIYDLINDIKEEMKTYIKTVIERKDLGRMKVLAIFRTEKSMQIIGGKVLDSDIESDSLIEVMRDKEMIGTGKAVSLQSGKQDVGSVEADQECGIQFEGSTVVEEGDVLQFYKEEEVQKSYE